MAEQKNINTSNTYSNNIEERDKGWKVVYKRRPYRKGFEYIGFAPKDGITKVYWNGFDIKGNERWFAEMKDGTIYPIRLVL